MSIWPAPHLLDLLGEAKARAGEHAQSIEHGLQCPAHEARDQRGHAHFGAPVVHLCDVDLRLFGLECQGGRFQREGAASRANVWLRKRSPGGDVMCSNCRSLGTSIGSAMWRGLFIASKEAMSLPGVQGLREPLGAAPFGIRCALPAQA